MARRIKYRKEKNFYRLSKVLNDLNLYLKYVLNKGLHSTYSLRDVTFSLMITQNGFHPDIGKEGKLFNGIYFQRGDATDQMFECLS